MSASGDLPHCQDCAACCSSQDERFAELSNVDFARLREEDHRLVVFRDGRCHMRTEPDGKCVALARLPDGRWACSIYERRPQVCRDFERGGDACRYEVAMMRKSESGE